MMYAYVKFHHDRSVQVWETELNKLAMFNRVLKLGQGQKMTLTLQR